MTSEMMPGIERLFQLPDPSSGNASPEFTSFFPSFSSFFFSTCDPSLPWAVLIFLAVPPSQAVNFQRLRVKPEWKLREGDLSYRKDGRAETAAAIEMQLLIGIDRATHVREQQSGAFTWAGHNHGVHRRGCASRPLHRFTIRLCVCVFDRCVRGRWYRTILWIHNKAFPDVSNPHRKDKMERSSSSSGGTETILSSHRMIDGSWR